MSGSNSSGPVSAAASAGGDSPLSFTVHDVPAPALALDSVRQTRNGRLKMLLVLAVCAAPVIGSYLAYFVFRPEGRTNYSELVEPQMPIPTALPLADLQGAPVATGSLKGQWLIVVASASACNTVCERHLWVQRQLRETLGRDKDRVDKVWLIVDTDTPSAPTLAGVTTNTDATVLRVPRAALGAWLKPAPGRSLEEHIYLVDPLGNWMMRAPPDPEPSKLKADVVKLLRASAGWDKAGR